MLQAKLPENKPLKLFRPIPQIEGDGLWINTGLFIEWAKIIDAQFIWRFGLPFIKVQIKSESILIYKKPEIPLFYREFKLLANEVRQHCPSDHVFYKAFPNNIPEKPYRLIYYGYHLIGLLISTSLVFGGLWFFGSYN